MFTHLETAIINTPENVGALIKTIPTTTTTTTTTCYYDVDVHNCSVSQLLQQRLEAITVQKDDPDQENAFFIADLGEIVRQHNRWKSLLPRIEPFYAIKCNTEPLVVQLLASLGCGFDCASQQEIQQVLDAGVDASRIIYANPCKQASFVRYAAQQNVSCMTFDNAEELFKIKEFYPDAELVLRILADDSMSIRQLGLKFGASLDTVQHLLETAKKLDLNVIGVSFHVGSGCLDENAFSDAVISAKEVFDQAKSMGYDFKLLDVGGGFSGVQMKEGTTFEKVAAVLGPIVDRLFPKDIRVIAEPGRFYVASAFTLAANIIGRRTVPDSTKATSDPKYMYYINDGMYGSFNDHVPVIPNVLTKEKMFMYGQDLPEAQYESSVWGPTCDSLDCLKKSTRLPKLEPGEWLYFENMGAYSTSMACEFNGFKKSKIFYTNTLC